MLIIFIYLVFVGGSYSHFYMKQLDRFNCTAAGLYLV